MVWSNLWLAMTGCSTGHSSDGYLRLSGGIATLGGISLSSSDALVNPSGDMTVCVWSRRSSSESSPGRAGLVYFDGSPSLSLGWTSAYDLLLTYAGGSVSFSKSYDVQWHHW